MSLSGSKPTQRRGFSPLVPEVHHAHYGDLESVHSLLKTTCPPDEVAAIFVEPIQGEGGYHAPPADFLPGLRALRRSRDPAGADEVQTGMGRTGKMFASEHWGVSRDILCLAKGIASGSPLEQSSRGTTSWTGRRVVTRAPSVATPSPARWCSPRSIWWKPGIERTPSVEVSNDVRPQCSDGQIFPMIKEVRGLGLMIGVEIQKDGLPAPWSSR